MKLEGRCIIEVPMDLKRILLFLVDTGVESNLIKQSALSENIAIEANKQVSFSGL